MPKHRKPAIAAAALLVVVHLVLLSLRYGTQFASLWGDWIAAATCLVAAIVCWCASRISGPFGKRSWRLVSFSLALVFLGQVFYTYYFDYLHVSSDAIWPSDILVFFWAVPAMMTLFISPRDPNSGFRWLRVCDFVQVCTLVLALELSLLYVPSRWHASEQAMDLRAFHVGLVFFALLALSFLVRGLLSSYPAARAFFLRMALFFFAFAITSNTTLFAFAIGDYQQGTWPDLMWTLTYCILIVIAAAWNTAEPTPPNTQQPFTPGAQLLAQFSPLIIPAIVFPLVLQIAQEQFFWAVLLVLISFTAASVRLFLVQRQLLHSSRELQKNLSLLQGITEGTTDAIFIKDLHGRYLMINSAGARSLDRSVNEILGKDDSQLFAPGNGLQIMARDRAVMRAGETSTYEELAITNSGTRTYLSTKGPYRDASGRVLGLLGICRDITDRRRAEEEIHKSQQRLRIHVEHTPLAVIEWDPEFRVVAWNAAAESIFGFSREEALGQHAHFIVPQDFRQQVAEVGQGLLEKKAGMRSTNDNITKDGRTISCEWYNTPLVDESGRVLGIASLVQDVTERVALEQKLRQSEKMEAIGRLAGGVAHDFNNILTVIMGYTHILTDGLPAESRLTDATSQIRSAAEHAAGITRQLLAFSRRQILAPQVIDLNEIMMSLDIMLRRLIGEDIEVLALPGRGLGAVNADPGQIEQVIMNLALNARDAMPNGGKLTLETENMELGDAYAREHPPLEPGRYVMLAVSDTGSGMSPDTQAHIFEPFFTTKEVGKGTGLGLSTVYGIVKRSGGYIWVYSEPGKGTTFKIYLPRVDQSPQGLRTEKEPTSAEGGTETILLVEDDAQLRELTSSILAQCGYRVLSAADAEEGLALCRANRVTNPGANPSANPSANQSNLHLLVTDVIMPGMNGRQLAEEIHKVSPHTKVLYVSGYTNNAIVHYGVLDPGLWFLPKPFSLSALVAKVREVLDAEPPFPDDASEKPSLEN
jgi:two-component system, cell cycle sensor histidine kinase and response regulator CckA